MRFFFVAFTTLSFSLAGGSVLAAAPPTWGRVVCEAVSAADALSFAQSSHFLDNWDFQHVAKPPYVAPAGTLACTLALQATADTDSDGHVFYTLQTNLLDQPFHLPPCTVTYFDGRRPRHFKPDGDGRGYLDLVPGSNDFDVNFFDNDQTKFQTDEFVAIQIGRSPQILWAGEGQDENPHSPIVSNCHVEL